MCSCLMCHENDAGSQRQRKNWVRVGISKDEDGWIYGATKKNQHKIRRTREKRAWKTSMLLDY